MESGLCHSERGLFFVITKQVLFGEEHIFYIYIFLTRISSKNLCKFELCVI